MLDVRRSPELLAALAALKQAQQQVRRDISKEAKTTVKPVWEQALMKHATTNLERAVLLPGASVRIAPHRVAVVAATRNRPRSGGLVPRTQWQGVEYGMQDRRVTFTARTRGGRSTQVERVAGRQFRGRQSRGYVVGPAAAEAGARIVAAWVHVVVEQFAGAFRVVR